MTNVLYVYAILPRAPRGPSLRGLAKERVRFLRSGRLVVAVGEVPAAPPPEIRNLRGHDLVVRRLAQATDAALPARFGSLAPSPAALRAALRPRARALLRALALVKNREQMTLRLTVPAQAPRPASGPGTRHLLGLAARDPHTRPAVRRLLELLRPLVRAERVELAGSDGVARLHHLIDRGSAARYRAQVRRAARTEPSLVVTCSGPWAPYSFAGDAGA